MRAKADIYQVRHRRVAEQQPWALLDNCEAQNLEKPRNGTREEGDPLALVSKSPHASTLREIARDPVSFAHKVILRRLNSLMTVPRVTRDTPAIRKFRRFHCLPFMLFPSGNQSHSSALPF